MLSHMQNLSQVRNIIIIANCAWRKISWIRDILKLHVYEIFFVNKIIFAWHCWKKCINMIKYITLVIKLGSTFCLYEHNLINKCLTCIKSYQMCKSHIHLYIAKDTCVPQKSKMFVPFSFFCNNLNTVYMDIFAPV